MHTQLHARELNQDDSSLIISSETSNAESTAFGRTIQCLPKFSEVAQLALTKDTLSKQNLSKFIHETAEFILLNGDMKTKDEYALFSRSMIRIYPSLDFSTPKSKEKPWVSYSLEKLVSFSNCKRLRIVLVRFSKCIIAISARNKMIGFLVFTVKKVLEASEVSWSITVKMQNSMVGSYLVE